jgi:8-oxo-dGTP pyrophosphatase MutT (NUDIX family)
VAYSGQFFYCYYSCAGKKKKKHTKTHMMDAATTEVRPAAETSVVIRGVDGRAYRRSIQVFFVNERGQFLICCPVGPTNRTFRQTVQGGSEAGEAPLATAVRETWEEIGLDITQNATFVAEVVPLSSLQRASNGTATTSYALKNQVETNEKGEMLTEVRAEFRYASKRWRKQGIYGQEMYPLVFFLPSQAIRLVNVNSRSRGVRQEFRAVYWGSLAELACNAPPVKKELMSNVCPAVAAIVLPFLAGHGYTVEDSVARYTTATAQRVLGQLSQ